MEKSLFSLLFFMVNWLLFLSFETFFLLLLTDSLSKVTFSCSYNCCFIKGLQQILASTEKLKMMIIPGIMITIIFFIIISRGKVIMEKLVKNKTRKKSIIRSKYSVHYVTLFHHLILLSILCWFASLPVATPS